MTRALAFGAFLLAAAAAWYAVRAASQGAAPEDEIQRDPPVLPQPGPAERAAFFFELVKSGEQTRVGANTISTWRVIGEPALVQLDRPALDYLLAEERTSLYRRAPSLLSNALRLLPSFPGAGSHPRLYPFLLYWADPKHAPHPTPGADWARDWRLLIFNVFSRFPDESSVPLCVEELTRSREGHDLRRPALDLLLALGRADLVQEHFERLPPTEEEKEPNLRLHLYQRLYVLAAPGQPEQLRAASEALAPLLRGALDSPVPMERIVCAAALLRLGDETMADRLLAMHAENPDDEIVGWSALIELVRDRPNERASELARARLAEPDGSVAFTSAVRICLWWLLDDPAVREAVWGLLQARTHVPALLVLPRFIRVDRERVVSYLEEELASGEWRRVEEAIRFAMRQPVREVGPTLLRLAREVPRVQRPILFGALVALGVRGVTPLLKAALHENNPDPLRDAAATELLNLGEGAEELAEAVDRGDPVVLQALGRSALSRGAGGVPPALVGPVLGQVRGAPGEEERLAALFILRCRGTEEGVRAGLIEAYRREPSRRVAREIEKVLVELAHR